MLKLLNLNNGDMVAMTLSAEQGSLVPMTLCEIDGDVPFSIWKEFQLPLSITLANHMFALSVAPDHMFAWCCSWSYVCSWCWWRWRAKRVVGWPVQADTGPSPARYWQGAPREGVCPRSPSIYINLEFINYCNINCILVLVMLLYSTHWLQPLMSEEM
jgi:hypothetical protein